MTETKPARELFRVEEVADMLSIGRTVVFKLLRDGELRSVKIGNSRRIPRSAVEDYLSRLEGAA